MRSWKWYWFRVFLYAVVASKSTAVVAITYDETTNGQLSATFNAPTSWGTLTAGSNTLRGSVNSSDRDYVTLKVPAGHQLDSLVVDAYSGGDPTSFIGVEAGTAMTVDPESFSATGLLGYSHFHPTDVGENILLRIGTGFGATGFTPPLPTGDYTFWIQQFSSDFPTTYQFNFMVSALPPAGITGDYNDDDVVDAADFVVWRKNVGASSLPNRDLDNSGPIGEADYLSWRENFDQSAGGDGSMAAIPEPASAVLLCCLGLGALASRWCLR